LRAILLNLARLFLYKSAISGTKYSLITKGKNKSGEIECRRKTPTVTPENNPKRTFFELNDTHNVTITGKRDMKLISLKVNY